MKKIMAAAGLALLGGALFAQGLVAPPQGRGPGPAVTWQAGTVVTTEYKKVTGTLVLDQTVDAILKADGLEYLLRVPPFAATLTNLKTGDAITVEGLAITFKGDTKTQPEFRPFKVTIAGKETDLRNQSGKDGAGGMGGQGRDGRDGRGPGGPGRPAPIDWKAGVVLTTEYKTLSGTLALAFGTAPTLKVGGVEYRLQLPVDLLRGLRTGDTLALQGLVNTVKGDASAKPWIQALVVTLGGKDVDVKGYGPDHDGPDRGGMGPGMGQGRR